MHQPLATTFILLNSVSDAFPNGMGNGSDQLGRNLMDHHYRVGASATSDDFKDQYTFGRRPTGFMYPVSETSMKPLRDQTISVDLDSREGQAGADQAGQMVLAAELKDQLTEPGDWSMWLGAWGEHLPYEDNRVTLNREKKDPFGLPMVDIDCEFKENEKIMRKDMMNSAAETLEAAGLKNVSTFDNADAYPGLCIHEMGTARMGNDPKTSVLNKWNQFMR